MNRMNRFFLSAFFLVALFGSCRLFQHTPELIPVADSNVPFFDSLFGRQPSYKALNIKFDAVYHEGKDKQAFAGTLKVVHDSAMQLIVSPALGVELMRAVVTTDSLKMIDRLKKTYTLAGISELEKAFRFELAFAQLETFLMGYYFNQASASSAINLMSGADGGLYHLHFAEASGSSDTLYHAMEFDGLFRLKEHRITMQRNTDMELLCSMKAMQQVEGAWYPSEVVFRAVKGKEQIRLELVFSKIEPSEGLSIQFSIPSRYTQSELKPKSNEQ